MSTAVYNIPQDRKWDASAKPKNVLLADITTTNTGTNLPFPDALAVASGPVQDESEVIFRELVTRWREDISFTSSLTDIVTHNAYQRIIGMGWRAIPFILRELEKFSEPWFWALEAITGEDPVRRDEWGNMRAMRDAWLNWARQHRLRTHRENFTLFSKAFSD